MLRFEIFLLDQGWIKDQVQFLGLLSFDQ